MNRLHTAQALRQRNGGWSCCALLLGALFGTPSPSLHAAEEAEPLLASADLVEASLLSGPGYRVLPQTRIGGFMARFTVETRWGPMLAESVELLEERAAEMAALDLLERVGLDDAFGIAVRERIEDTAEAVGQVLSSPVATVTGLPAGVVRYFRDQAGRWGDRLSRHGDRIAHKVGNDGDPYDFDGPISAHRELQPERRKRRWFSRGGREVGRQVERQAGHGRARRMLARELGIDPYAAGSNPELRAQLDRLAWAAAAGNFAAGEAFGQITGFGASVLSTSGRLNELVWELAPDDLRRRNQEVLERWCGDELQLRRFLRHGVFLASVQTRFVDALDALAPASGCELLLDLALGAEHDVEARFLANALRMSVDHLGAAAQGADLEAIGAGLALRLRDGRRVLPLPVDYLSWTGTARSFFGQRELRDGERVVLVAGDVSPQALRELTGLGWEIVVRTPYAGAPAYARRCC